VVLALVHIWTKRALQGIAECERALELDRNLAQAHLQEWSSRGPPRPHPLPKHKFENPAVNRRQSCANRINDIAPRSAS